MKVTKLFLITALFILLAACKMDENIFTGSLRNVRIETEKTRVFYNEEITLQAMADHPADTEIAYTWLCTDGTLVNKTGEEVNWKAPEINGDVTIVLIASLEGSGKEMKESLTITVDSAPAASSLESVITVSEDNGTPKVRVHGDLQVDGSVHSGAVFTGNIQPTEWSYATTSTTWQELWSGQVIIPKDSVIIISIMGHISVNSGNISATASIDGQPIHTGIPTNKIAYGILHTYSTTWETLSLHISSDISKGTHRLGLSALVSGGNTGWANGAALYYVVIPK